MLNYVLKFGPILKQKIWGGNKLRTYLNKDTKTKAGESWEISGVEDDVSVVSNGEYEGRTLNELIKEFKGELVGNKVFDSFVEKFPLLIKFIDAKLDLSIQLHPNDTLANDRHNSFGKTEMWYVVQADYGSQLIVGFNRNINRDEYFRFLEKEEIEEILNYEAVEQGDSFFISAGRVHAIGKGVLIAEIQQTSDVTYRIYDWKRKDENGEYRELHTDLALDAIDFESNDSHVNKYNKNNYGASHIASCQYFTTVFLNVENHLERNHIDKDSFVIYMCVEGSGYINIDNNETRITLGETVLIPATIDKIILIGKRLKLLEVYI